MRIHAAVLAAIVVAGVPSLARAYRHPDREFRHSSLQLDPQLVEAADGVFNDARTGRPSSLMLSVPLVPGTGVGNTLGWDQPPSEAMIGDRAWTALLRYLDGQRKTLGVDAAELAAPRVGVFEDGALILIHAPRALGGIPVRDSGLTAVVNHGNLVLLGLQSWDEAGRSGAWRRSAKRRHAPPCSGTRNRSWSSRSRTARASNTSRWRRSRRTSTGWCGSSPRACAATSGPGKVSWTRPPASCWPSRTRTRTRSGARSAASTRSATTSGRPTASSRKDGRCPSST